MQNFATMTSIDAIILGLVEGITEFLPVSSTGHLVLAGHFMNLESNDFTKAFDVIIQFGAIISVLFLYFRKLIQKPKLIQWMILGFIPTAIIGFLLKNWVDQFLESTQLVAWALILGGFLLIWIDHWYDKSRYERKSLADLSTKDSLLLGVYQCAALIPGVSRSGATIFSGMLLKYDKKEATEFSFLLALPTLTAASLYKLFKIREHLHFEKSGLLLIGTLVAFISAWLAVKFFVRIVGQYGFKYFGYYRILLGVTVLLISWNS